MSSDHGNDPEPGPDSAAGKGESQWAAGDDERENREHIAETGEPKRDALGNAEGAS